jgi:ferredoxin-NADP reductase
MILLVTSSERASECAAAVKAATGEPAVVAENLALATARLREKCYLAVVLDQHLLESEPHEAEIMFEHLDTAIPVQVNLAICGMERLLREVRVAVQRRHCEEARAHQAALGRLQSEVNGTVTALLLSVELALETAGMLAVPTEKVQSIHDLVKKLKRQLAAAGTMAETDSSSVASGGR